MSYKVLVTEEVIEMYRSLLDGDPPASCGRVASIFNTLNYRTPRGKPLTRQAIAYHMNKTREGQKLLKRGVKRNTNFCEVCGQFVGDDHDCPLA